MGNAPSMSGAQGIGQRYRQVEKSIQVQAAFRNNLVQVLSFHKFHGEEPDPFGLVNAIDGDDVGMIEGGDRFGLPLETVAAAGVRGHFGGKNLQGDSASQFAILGKEDLS